MRSVLLSISFILLGFHANAQWSQGSILATGNLGFASGSTKVESNSTTTTTTKTSSFNFGLNGGYFIQDNLAVGLRIGYQTNATTNPQTDITTSYNTFSYGAFGRYYLPVNEAFAFYGQLAVDLSNGSANNTDESSFSTGAGVGMSYFLTDVLFLDANYGFLGYTSNKSTNNGVSTRTGSFGLNLDITSINFGVGILF